MNQTKYDLPVSVEYSSGDYLNDKIRFIVTPPEAKKNELFWRCLPDSFKRAGSTNNLQLTFMGSIASLSSKIRKNPPEVVEETPRKEDDEAIITFVREDLTVNSVLSEVFNNPKDYEFNYQRIDEVNGAAKILLSDIFNKMFVYGKDFKPKPSTIEMQQFDFIKNFYDIISGDVMNIDRELTKNFLTSYSLNELAQTTELIGRLMTNLRSKKVDPRFLIMLNAVILAGAKTFNAL
ncbi:MAG: hypothetical protein WC557_01805 [Ignavibacteriaceae bacterium]